MAIICAYTRYLSIVEFTVVRFMASAIAMVQSKVRVRCASA